MHATPEVDKQRWRGVRKKSSDFDTLWLLEKIKKTTAGVDTKANPALTLHEQMLIFMTTRQGQSESDDDYLRKFNSRLKNMILAGGIHVLWSPQILGKDMISCTPMEINTEKERFKAMCFILRANKIGYSDILEELRRGVYRGKYKYPTTVSDEYKLLLRWSQQMGYTQKQTGQLGYRAQADGKSEGFMFAQQGGRSRCRAERRNENNQEEVAGHDKIFHRGVRCYSFQRNGHYSDQFQIRRVRS